MDISIFTDVGHYCNKSRPLDAVVVLRTLTTHRQILMRINDEVARLHAAATSNGQEQTSGEDQPAGERAENELQAAEPAARP